MQQIPLGHTGLTVSRLGLGAGQLGDASLDEAGAARLIHAAVDAGITFIDTARGYGTSEERLGRHLGHRRQGVALCTKVGYGTPGIPDWTGPCITQGIDDALHRLRTPWLDVALLHSCPAETLARGEVIDALERARAAGKVRAIGYSGENDALDAAVATGRFSVFEASVNLCDQRSVTGALARAFPAGIIAKRPMANAFWRHDAQPHGQYVEPYWLRARAMGLGELAPGVTGVPWHALALRFALSTGVVHTAIAGTTRVASLMANVEAAEAGPLPPGLYAELRRRFEAHGRGWGGEI